MSATSTRAFGPQRAFWPQPDVRPPRIRAARLRRPRRISALAFDAGCCFTSALDTGFASTPSDIPSLGSSSDPPDVPFVFPTDGVCGYSAPPRFPLKRVSKHERYVAKKKTKKKSFYYYYYIDSWPPLVALALTTLFSWLLTGLLSCRPLESKPAMHQVFVKLLSGTITTIDIAADGSTTMVTLRQRIASKIKLDALPADCYLVAYGGRRLLVDGKLTLALGADATLVLLGRLRGGSGKGKKGASSSSAASAGREHGDGAGDCGHQRAGDQDPRIGGKGGAV